MEDSSRNVLESSQQVSMFRNPISLVKHETMIMSVKEYYNRLIDLWKEMALVYTIPCRYADDGVQYNKILEKDQILDFLQGLNETWMKRVSSSLNILDLLKENGKLGCHAASVPLEKKWKHKILENDPPTDKVTMPRWEWNQHLVGKLIYLSLTRSDIACNVSIVS